MWQKVINVFIKYSRVRQSYVIYFLIIQVLCKVDVTGLKSSGVLPFISGENINLPQKPAFLTVDILWEIFLFVGNAVEKIVFSYCRSVLIMSCLFFKICLVHVGLFFCMICPIFQYSYRTHPAIYNTV